MFKRIAKVLIYKVFFVLNLPALLLKNVNFGKHLLIRGKVYIKNSGNKKGYIKIGNNVKLNSSLKADPIGGQDYTVLYAMKNGKISIGDFVGISNTAIVAQTYIEIGEYTNIGGGTKIYDTDFHSLEADIRLHGDCDVKSQPIYIGKKVFIGGHTIILKGVSVGDGAVIGAGSVVTHNIPSGEIWAGNPAKFVRKVK